MATLATLRGLRPSITKTTTSPLLTIPSPAAAAAAAAAAPSTRATLSTTAPVLARKHGQNQGGQGLRGGGGGGGSSDQNAAKIANIRKNLFGPAPPPLRMARNRHLRHWTIHRAWLMLQRQQREHRERELYRMHQCMWNANEELRNTSGPGTRDKGWLYRVAQEKKGVYGPGAVPIDYARFQTETPARLAWDHDWKR